MSSIFHQQRKGISSKRILFSAESSYLSQLNFILRFILGSQDVSQTLKPLFGIEISKQSTPVSFSVPVRCNLTLPLVFMYYQKHSEGRKQLRIVVGSWICLLYILLVTNLNASRFLIFLEILRLLRELKNKSK